MVVGHNQIDATLMSRVVGMAVMPRDFTLVEDRQKALLDGVSWRRRRFIFQVLDDSSGEARQEALCLNEITIDSHSPATIAPQLAAHFPGMSELEEIQNAYWATTFASGAIRGEAGVRQSRLYANCSAILLGDPDTHAAAMLARLADIERTNTRPDTNDPLLDPLEPVFVDLHDGAFGLARYLPAFPVSRLVQSSAEILAATNGGYFLNFPEEYDDGVSPLHLPVGGHIIDGRLVVPPWLARPGIIGVDDDRLETGIFGPSDIELLLEDLPPVPLRTVAERAAHGTVWRHFEPRPAVSDNTLAAVRFCAAYPVDASRAPETGRPPFGGATVFLGGEHARAVLDAAGPSPPVHLRLRVDRFAQPHWMVSAGPLLLVDGRPVESQALLAPEHAGEFHPDGPAPTRFPYDADRTRAPRTALGTLPSGGLKLLVVDGRRPAEHSCGLTLEGMAHLAQLTGCETAINLDGGGSSVLAVEGAGPEDMLAENAPHGLVNLPSDKGGTERIVPLFLTVRARETHPS